MKNQNISQLDMMKNKSMVGATSQMQQLGKGKRKYSLKMEKTNKKFLAKLMTELKKQVASYGEAQQAKGMLSFLTYIEKNAGKKEPKKVNSEIKITFAELNFLKQTVKDSIVGMEKMEFKWYQVFKKIIIKMMIKQYKMLFEDINK